MIVLGIDAGFSKNEKTSAYCLMKIADGKIELLIEPQKFIFEECVKIFDGKFLENVDVITIDAPMTLEPILEKPSTGRKIDKLFSGDIFNNSKRGPQPGSISTPKQGWPLYESGMVFKKHFERNGFNYKVFNNSKLEKKSIIEVIPKLTQALPLESQLLVSRPKNSQIDNFLFQYTFENGSCFRNCFGDISFSEDIELLIDKYTSNTKKYHEELAGLLAALQGVLYTLGSYSIIGFEGSHEGHYLLPPIESWNSDWETAFQKRKCKYKDVIIESKFHIL
ncbi:hypothetical protein IZY60_04450 [Lutibacter sp. B2]|nr:hypothetical protein [Lutibacter sp. B2]